MHSQTSSEVRTAKQRTDSDDHVWLVALGLQWRMLVAMAVAVVDKLEVSRKIFNVCYRNVQHDGAMQHSTRGMTDGCCN